MRSRAGTRDRRKANEMDLGGESGSSKRRCVNLKVKVHREPETIADRGWILQRKMLRVG